MAMITELNCNLREAVHVKYLDGNLFSQDVYGNALRVIVMDGDEPATLAGTVSGTAIREDGSTVALTDSRIDENVATVVLPAAAYAVPGVLAITIKISDTNTVTTLAYVVANVYRTSTDTVVDPGTIIPSITSLIEQIAEAVASIPADYSSLWAALAETFNASKSGGYAVGKYVTYDGGLYRFKNAHTGSWSSSDVDAVNLGSGIAKNASDISELKSAIDNLTDVVIINNFITRKFYRTGSGDTIVPGSPSSSSSSFVCAYAPCVEGDVFTIDIYNAGTANNRPWCFIDQNGSQLKKAPSNNGYYKNAEIVAPENAAYVVINAAKAHDYRFYKGSLVGKRVTDLEKETDEIEDILDRMIVKYTLIDGYNESNNSSVNINRAPWMFPSKNGNAVITSVKLNIKTAGTLSFGIYDSIIQDGDTYDSSKYQLIKAFTITGAGEQTLMFDEPVQIPKSKAFAIGLSTDTAVFAYGSYGEKGFYYNVDGTITYYKSASLGITVSGYETGSGSVLSGKLVSIYGDSISTFRDWIPEGNATYYPASGVSKVQQTWWKKTIDALGLNLVVNNSWSGRAVSSCRDSETAHSTDAGYKEANVLQLKDGTILPEIIIVKLGINDFNHGAYLGTYDGSTELPTDPSLFTNAYAMMLNLIMTNFPLAKVYCCTLMQCEMNNSVTGFPEINTQGESLIQWNEAISKLAHAFGAEVLDHDVCGITYYNLSTYMGDYSSSTHKGLHPNASGHSLIANKTILQLDPTVKQRF